MSTTPLGVIQDSTSTLDTDLALVAGAGIAVGAVLFAIRKGWRTFRGMV